MNLKVPLSDREIVSQISFAVRAHTLTSHKLEAKEGIATTLSHRQHGHGAGQTHRTHEPLAYNILVKCIVRTRSLVNGFLHGATFDDSAKLIFHYEIWTASLKTIWLGTQSTVILKTWTFLEIKDTLLLNPRVDSCATVSTPASSLQKPQTSYLTLAFYACWYTQNELEPKVYRCKKAEPFPGLTTIARAEIGRSAVELDVCIKLSKVGFLIKLYQ